MAHFWNWFPSEPRPGELAFRLDYNMDTQSQDLYILQQNRQGEVFVAEPLNFHKHEGCCRAAPAIRIPDLDTQAHFQALFNCLWAAGYRPAQTMKQDAIIEAKDAHLEDLRKVLFSTLKVK